MFIYSGGWGNSFRIHKTFFTFGEFYFIWTYSVRNFEKRLIFLLGQIPFYYPFRIGLKATPISIAESKIRLLRFGKIKFHTYAKIYGVIAEVPTSPIPPSTEKILSKRPFLEYIQDVARDPTSLAAVPPEICSRPGKSHPQFYNLPYKYSAQHSCR